MREVRALNGVKLCSCGDARPSRIGWFAFRIFHNAIEVLVFLLKRHKQMQTSVNTLEMNSESLASQQCSIADRKCLISASGNNRATWIPSILLRVYFSKELKGPLWSGRSPSLRLLCSKLLSRRGKQMRHCSLLKYMACSCG